MGSDEGPLQVESSVAPPVLNCPHCDGMLPLGLGEIDCGLCGSKVRVDHAATRRQWREEKLACPSCSKVLIAGVEERPARIRCSSCDNEINITAKAVKVELACPACERRLRIRPRPGSRDLTCPACEEEFRVTF